MVSSILLYLKWLTHKVLLDSTGNSTQCYVAAWMSNFGGETDIGICMTEPLCCLPKTITTLLNGYQFSRSVVANSLRLHGLQHARPPCPSPTPRVYSNSCPLSRWCHPTISSSVDLFSSHLQSFPASGSFQMSQFFASSDQSIGTSVSESVLPMNIQDRFPLGWTGWISLLSKESWTLAVQESPPTPQFKSTNSSALSCLYSPTLTSIYDYWKNYSFD